MKKYKPKFTEKIDGGLADNLSIKDIAEKHNVEFSVILDQIEKGIQVEYEHTNNFDIAKEIAMDHLVEYPYYYDELEKMEKKFEHKRGIEVKKYKPKFIEQNNEDKNNNGIPDWLDDKISDVLEQLRDGNFGNAEGRQQFLDLITTLFNSKDKRARKSFKAISDLFSEIGDELVKYGLPVEGEELEESLLKENYVSDAFTVQKKIIYEGDEFSEGVIEINKPNMKTLQTTKVAPLRDLHNLYSRLEQLCIKEIKKFR